MNQEDPSLVDKVSEDISTDTIADLKTGIYNLFVNLINNQIVYCGPEMAVKLSIDFLQEIIYNFNKAIQPEQEQE
jgi:hypothetical protein